MPTGYTAKIYEGTDESLQDLLLHLARGMGAYFTQRDEGTNESPKPLTVGDYYYATLARANDRLNVVVGMSEEDKKAGFEAAVKDINKENADRFLDNLRLRKRYDEVIAQVNSLDWYSPKAGGDEDIAEFFIGYHKFVTEQLTDSKRFDVSSSPYMSSVPVSVESWYADQLSSASRAVEYASKNLSEEIEQVSKQNKIHNYLMNWIDSQTS